MFAGGHFYRKDSLFVDFVRSYSVALAVAGDREGVVMFECSICVAVYMLVVVAVVGVGVVVQ
jgi:hypothetical protein